MFHSSLRRICFLHSLKTKSFGYRAVSTLSPLEAAFNCQPQVKLDIKRDNVGLFNIPELRDYHGFYLLQENVKLEADELVEEATSKQRKRKLVKIFDELSDCLCRVADMADFIRVSHPDGSYARAAEEACISISGLVEKMNTNVQIHAALRQVIQNGDVIEMDSIDRRVAELFMFDFEQSGIHLEEDQRREFVRLNEATLVLGTHFMQGAQKPVTLKRSLLPEHLRYAFGTDNGHSITVTGMSSDNHNALIREAAYRIYLHPDKHQEELLNMLLQARDQLGKLVGFPSYAHRALRGTLGGTPENVKDFLETLAIEVLPRSERDFEVLRKTKRDLGMTKDDVRPWDTAYLTGLARHDVCEIHSLDLAPYFSLGTCMAGLSDLLSKLFGVRLQAEEAGRGELWSDDVHKLAVIHETEGLLGHIYCDLFERSGKPHTDCHFTIQGGRMKEDGRYQNPIVVLLLNFPPPRPFLPSLLTPGMVENLFHEFGHAMHSMLGRTRYQHVTGTRCPTDFAEVPSILMEYFVNDPRVIATFARHWQTGQPLDETKIRNLCSAKQMFGASETQLQVFYSLVDQVFHGPHPLPDTTTNLVRDLQNKYYNIPHEHGTAWHLRFGHFVGYGAKYYSYLMSRAVAASIWHKFFKEQPFNRTIGEKYRQTMLAHGGERHPSELIRDMLGEEPNNNMLVQSLVMDLDEP
ncbi:hypothetical protein LSH36_222g03005 [Paralvinella palmiformis]|uniref:Peptidase M3A/M3B catalytic domain-containing protein n=1 Tax=Paralvinella palmiformis TaxID=53620 RepID=A0AAD9N5T8_9ANNE|nr:hypothetical protein LSH36_222g03005 [Paralvinella palmiformis]